MTARTSIARRRIPWFAAAAAVAALAVPSITAAQSVTLDTYRAAETPEDGFAISRPTDLGHLRFAVQLHLDYAWNPLVYEATLGDAGSETTSIVEHQLVGNLGLAFGLWDRLVVFAGLPVNLLMVGDEVTGYPAADGTTLGDVYFGARVRIWGERADWFTLGFQVTGTAPTAEAADSGQSFAGEGFWTIHPELLAEFRPGAGIAITLDIGARFREFESFRSFDVGHELTWGLGLMVPIVQDRLDAHVEVYGTTTFEQFGDREGSPIEAIAGLKVQPVPGLRLGLGAGPGLQRGYGSPDVRALFTVGWAMPEEAAPEPELQPVDTDGDTLLDPDDGCPEQPEDVDDFEDADGCPDPDNDADGILDADDDCPDEPETMNGVDDADGCPDFARRGVAEIAILKPIQFRSNSDEILPESFPVLADVGSIMQAHPEINLVVAANDYEAIGAAQALKSLGRTDVLLYGNDGDTTGLEQIYAGDWNGTVNTTPFVMGKIALQVTMDVLNGKFPGGWVETPTVNTTKDNALSFLCHPENLYPKPSKEYKCP